MIKYSELLAIWLKEMGYTHCFYLAGGGCMHLIDGFRRHFQCIPVVHEVTAGIAAEHFNECTTQGKGFALVTTGPGLTNIVTAIAACYTEHRQLLVIAGQVKTTDLLTPPVRQRGTQEIDGVALCSSITVQAKRLTNAIGKEEFQSIVKSSSTPHPGPVLIEVCLDVQGMNVDESCLEPQNQSHSADLLDLNLRNEDAATEIASALRHSRRPLILLGGLVDRLTARDFRRKLEELGLPCATTTSAIDRIPTDSPIFAGRPGTWGGQRAANLIIAQADLVIAVGVQLDLQQTGFNYEEYAPNARIYQIFPSDAELSKPGPKRARTFNLDANGLLRSLQDKLEWSDETAWLPYLQSIRRRLPPEKEPNVTKEGVINSFELLRNIFLAADSEDIFAISSSGGTFTGSLQMANIKDGQIATTSTAFASMGWGLATAIGAAIANSTKRIIHIEGEGSFSQNLQELALLKKHRFNIVTFLFDNEGYASIRATQKKFFNGDYVGCDAATGLEFPTWEPLFSAYDIPTGVIEPTEIGIESIAKMLSNHRGPRVWIAKTDPEQTNWPAVATKLFSDGKLYSCPLWDMLPKIDESIWKEVSIYLQPHSDESNASGGNPIIRRRLFAEPRSS